MCGTLECQHIYSWDMYDDGYMVAWYEYANYDHLICQVIRPESDLRPDKGTLNESVTKDPSLSCVNNELFIEYGIGFWWLVLTNGILKRWPDLDMMINYS